MGTVCRYVLYIHTHSSSMARTAADRHAPKTINEASSWSDDVHAQQREWKLRQERTGVTPADKLWGYAATANKFNRSDVIHTEAEWQLEAAMQSIDICISRPNPPSIFHVTTP